MTKRVEAMLSLYFQPVLSDETDLMAATIWLDVLGDIPQAAIEQACREWERDQEKRPTPAGIRKRALARIIKPETDQADRGGPFEPTVTPETELDRRRKQQAELQKQFPMLRKIPRV